MHLAIDINSHKIIAAKFNASNITGGEVRPNLLKQIRRKINEISAYGAYDTRPCYETIHIKRVVPLILPEKVATFGKQGHQRNLAISYQKLYGLNQH
ncbi:hypothetical protein [Candidatus Enterovibrio altilux]|uniref:Mobile element protein n=1 Tax=Candidatus Enterovibrio altilux TaxID=1927128 RepID=A0A291BAE2_9GAMM|nr:hypothetical protein BTN50_1481 [Candidatus Enterovibrio luxaltus]